MADDVAGAYPDCLRDESRLTGAADSISFPRSEDELKNGLASARDVGRAVTTQGGLTGITGGAVPNGGHVLNLSRMDRVLGLRRSAADGAWLLSVQPGILLAGLRDSLAGLDFDTEAWTAESIRALAEIRAEADTFFFAPDPTESSASIGGMASCNASGALSFFYGPTRRHIHSARIVLADGSVLTLERGREAAEARTYNVCTDTGRRVSGQLPRYKMPNVKNAAGYFAEDDMDLLDLFIGSEGTLGIFSQLELRLVPSPVSCWGVTVFLPSEDAVCEFVESVRAADRSPVAIEYFDSLALDLLRRQKETNPAFGELPEIPADWDSAVYVEYHGGNDDQVEAAVADMCDTLTQCGGSDESTWLASGKADMQKLKDFRHSVPEAVNLLVDERRKQEPGLTKLGTDLAVPDPALRATLRMYREDLATAGLEHLVFGHIGNNHVHVNILPHTMREYEVGKELYANWAGAAVRLGGTVSAEHGIGKLKTALLEEMYGPAGIEEMRRVKASFDPEWLLNEGNLFPRVPAREDAPLQTHGGRISREAS